MRALWTREDQSNLDGACRARRVHRVDLAYGGPPGSDYRLTASGPWGAFTIWGVILKGGDVEVQSASLESNTSWTAKS